MNKDSSLQNIPSGDEEMEARLWEYIDGLSEAREREAIEQLLAENTKWREKYHTLLEIHQSLDLVELEQPSLRFTKNVMEAITQMHIAPAARQYINQKVIWGIALFFITVIASFLIYGISQIQWSAPSQVNSTVLDRIADADYGRMFDNTFVNIFLMLNVVLGLMLFDRYLNDKRKKRIQGA